MAKWISIKEFADYEYQTYLGIDTSGHFYKYAVSHKPGFPKRQVKLLIAEVLLDRAMEQIAQNATEIASLQNDVKKLIENIK